MAFWLGCWLNFEMRLPSGTTPLPHDLVPLTPGTTDLGLIADDLDLAHKLVREELAESTRAGYDVAALGGHSLRVGFVTSGSTLSTRNAARPAGDHRLNQDRSCAMGCRAGAVREHVSHGSGGPAGVVAAKISGQSIGSSEARACLTICRPPPCAPEPAML